MSSLNIYTKLMAAIGNEYGVCGLMGNIQAESAMKSNNLQNSGNIRLSMTDEEYTEAVDNGTYKAFASDSKGFGLCQWTSSGRKAALLNYATANCISIGNEDMQVGFLVYELNNSYKNVLNVLKKATSVKEASDYVVKKFERPKNQSVGVLNARYAKGMAFYEEFAEQEVARMIKPVDYKQGDYRWGSNSYAVDGETSTIKSAGCGPTAMANVLAAIVSPYIDPLTCASWARMHGYKVYKSGTSYQFPVAIGQEYGVKVRQINTSNVYGKTTNSAHTEALAELKNGNWLIACMGKGLWTSSGHYITVYDYQSGRVYINDPASTKADRACNLWSTFINQVKYYWVVEVPEEIKRNGIVKNGAYRHEDYVRECQMCLKASLTGKPDALTLSKTVTVSRKVNSKHNVVYPLQKQLKYLGMYTGKLDRSAGLLMELGINKYQETVLNYSKDKQDGEITARKTMWKSLLGI